MVSNVKGRPTYRQQQAAATRDRIAEAARELFAERGYGATSIDAIAAAAGVAVRTVYTAFGTKREMLSYICERWLEKAEARQRAEAVLADPDPAGRLQGAAAWLTHLYATDFAVVMIFEAATDESAETRDLLRAKLAGRNEVMDAMIASLGDHLVAPVEQAQAVYRALAAPGVYRELVVETGWTPQAFEDWLLRTLRAHVLGPARRSGH